MTGSGMDSTATTQDALALAGDADLGLNASGRSSHDQILQELARLVVGADLPRHFEQRPTLLAGQTSAARPPVRDLRAQCR